MSRIHKALSATELAAAICEELRRHQIQAVLVGGTVVSIYSDGQYVSDDLDFVTHKTDAALSTPLQALGFKKKAMHWEHPDTEFLVQFVNLPVMVGNKYVQVPDQLRTPAGTITILSPLDCVLDRLSWYLSHQDRQCLEQAVSVAIHRRVSLNDVESWLRNEDGDRRANLRRFEEFKAKVLAAQEKNATAHRADT